MDELILNHPRTIEEQGKILEQFLQRRIITGILLSVGPGWLTCIFVESTPFTVVVCHHSWTVVGEEDHKGIAGVDEQCICDIVGIEVVIVHVGLLVECVDASFLGEADKVKLVEWHAFDEMLHHRIDFIF